MFIDKHLLLKMKLMELIVILSLLGSKKYNLNLTEDTEKNLNFILQKKYFLLL